MEENSENKEKEQGNKILTDPVNEAAEHSYDYEDIRSKFAQSSSEQVSREKIRKLLRWLTGILGVIVLCGLLVFALVQGVKVYQNNQAAIAATQLAEALAVKIQNADNFMVMGNPAEALSIYEEVKQIDPAYPDVDERIKEAENFIEAVELYQKGMQFLDAEDYDQALETFFMVEQLRHDYLDTLELIQQLEQDKEIAGLIAEIKDNYASENWKGVIQNYEAILEIDPFIELPELKEIIFKSYRNEIIALSMRNDLTLEEIEVAEDYYRKAIALVPQDKEYSKDREELKKIAAEIIANKYFLDALLMLEESNYSYEGLRKAVPVLKKAQNFSGDSFLIRTEIEKAELFLGAYDNLLRLNWAGAIDKLEVLLRKDKNYADGRARYFLYEAYISRGDMLNNYSDFENAFLDYQEAEKIAWSEEENPLRLFQAQLRVAEILGKLNKVDGSAEYYNFAFNKLDYENVLTNSEDQELLETLRKANEAFVEGSFVEAVNLYETAVAQQQVLFDQKTISVKQGDILLIIAFEQGVTIEYLRSLNTFGKIMVFDNDQDIFVPVVSASSP